MFNLFENNQQRVSNQILKGFGMGVEKALSKENTNWALKNYLKDKSPDKIRKILAEIYKDGKMNDFESGMIILEEKDGKDKAKRFEWSLKNE